VGVSLLDAVGLRAGWVARSQDEYVVRAVAAAADLPALAALRAGLRPRMLASRLCDGPAFVARLEGVYRGLWHRWLAREGHAAEPDAAGPAEAAAGPTEAAAAGGSKGLPNGTAAAGDADGGAHACRAGACPGGCGRGQAPAVGVLKKRTGQLPGAHGAPAPRLADGG